MTDLELHNRLDALGKHIAARQAEIDQDNKLFKADHRLTGKELEAQYLLLKSRLDRDVADEAAHGHDIGNLEISVRAWFESLDARI